MTDQSPGDGVNLPTNYLPDSIFICDEDFEDENKIMRAPHYDCDVEYVRIGVVEALRQQLAAAQSEIDNQAKAYGLLNVQLAASEAAKVVLERDAARYRWLKMDSKPCQPFEIFERMLQAKRLVESYEVFCSGWTEWDEKIDTALQRDAEGGK